MYVVLIIVVYWLVTNFIYVWVDQCELIWVGTIDVKRQVSIINFKLYLNWCPPGGHVIWPVLVWIGVHTSDLFLMVFQWLRYLRLCPSLCAHHGAFETVLQLWRDSLRWFTIVVVVVTMLYITQSVSWSCKGCGCRITGQINTGKVCVNNSSSNHGAIYGVDPVAQPSKQMRLA